MKSLPGRRRSFQRRLGPTDIPRTLERVEPVVADADLRAGGYLQELLAVVALVAVAAIGVADVGLDAALAAAEPVFAAGVLAVHQAEQFVFDLLEFGG